MHHGGHPVLSVDPERRLGVWGPNYAKETIESWFTKSKKIMNFVSHSVETVFWFYLTRFKDIDKSASITIQCR